MNGRLTPPPRSPNSLSLITSPSRTPCPSKTFPPTLDLLRGHPSTSLLPVSDLFSSTSLTLHTPAFLPPDSYASTRHPLHYGADLGNLSTRIEIGRWVAEKYSHIHTSSTSASSPTPYPPINPDHICLTNGASYALAEALRQFTSPITGYTKRAFLVSPTYFLAARIFEDAGFADKLTAIPSSTSGASTTIDFPLLESHLSHLSTSTPDIPLSTALRPLLRRGATRPEGKRLYKYVLYCVPTYSNPTGTTLDLSTRTRLIALARKYDILLITDDVYDFLGNLGDTSALGVDGRLLPRLVSLDAATLPEGEEWGHTVSNCSFSKLVGPGLRCGWIETPTPRLAAVVGAGGANHSGGTPGQFASTIIHPLLLPRSPRDPTRQIDTIIDHFRTAYTSHCETALRAIQEFLPEGTEVQGGRGGFFMWLKFPRGIDAKEVVKIAGEKEGVVVMGGEGGEVPNVEEDGEEGMGMGMEMGYSEGVEEGLEGLGRNRMGWGERCIRISVSYLEAINIEEGVRRLGAAVGKWREGRARS